MNQGQVIWFTGLSGSGKTTLANELKIKKEETGSKIIVLDGDIVRNTLHRNLGFSREDIKENNKLIATLAKEYTTNHDFVLVPIISPYEEDRSMARNIIGENFLELYVNASLNECIQRDVKGLYKKALAGEITNFIGVAKSNPYEHPKNPELEVKTGELSLNEGVASIIASLKKKQLFNNLNNN